MQDGKAPNEANPKYFEVHLFTTKHLSEPRCLKVGGWLIGWVAGWLPYSCAGEAWVRWKGLRRLRQQDGRLGKPDH